MSVAEHGPVTELIRSTRALTDGAELLAAAPQLVARLGFDRVIVSQADAKQWVPAALYVANDAKWARDILAAGRSAPTPLGAGLVEDRMLRTLRPIAVHHVQGNPRVNKAIATVSRSLTFLAAPILCDGSVAGFLHVDRYWSRAAFDQHDAAALQSVADAIGLCLERATLRQRLHELAGRPADTATSSLLATLTPREIQVTAMIAEGLTNTQIAAELVVELSTVKSHVKHVLRKLGARHRAELVSMFLRAAP